MISAAKSQRPVHLHLILAAFLVATPASAAIFTWDGGGDPDPNWTNGLNWVGDVAPTDVAFHVYQFGGNVNLTTNNNLTPGAGGINVDDLTFLAGAGSFTLSGTYFDMLGTQANTGDTADIVNNSSNKQTIALRLEARPDFTTALVFNTASGDIEVTGQVTSNSNSASEFVRKTGANTLIFAANNTYGSTTQVNQGALRITNGGALGATSAGTTVAADARLELSGGITVSGEALTITGTGGDNFGAVRSVGGSNTWSGSITLAASGARIGATGGSTLIVSGPITGAGFLLPVRTDATSKVVLTNAANDYGDTQVVTGTLQIGGGDNRLPIGGLLRMGNSGNTDTAAFDLNGNNQEVAGLLSEGTTMATTVTNTSATAATLTVNNSANFVYRGLIAGNLALDKQGAGTLELTNDKDHTFSGPTNVRGGVLDINSAGLSSDVFVHNTATLLLRSPGFDSIDDTADVTVHAGGLMDVRENENLDGLYGDGDIDHNTSGTHFLGVNKGDFSGTIVDTSGALRLEKNSSGLLTLSGVNSYSGGTILQNGTLLVNNTSGSGTGTGTVTVNGGTLGGTGAIAGSVNIGDAVLSPGESIGTLATGSLTLGALSDSLFELSVPWDASVNSLPSPNDLVVVTGNLTLDGTLTVDPVNPLTSGVYTLFTASGTIGGQFDTLVLPGYGGWIEVDGGAVNLNVVPEPSTIAMLLGLVGIGLLGYLRRRR